jgi:hypothetical protein
VAVLRKYVHGREDDALAVEFRDPLNEVHRYVVPNL